MAKLRYYAAIPDSGPVWTTPFVPDFKLDTHSGTFADFIPEAMGSPNVAVTFRGTGFVYNGTSDFIDGTVKSITFTSGNDVFAKLSGLSLSAADAQVMMEDSPMALLIAQLQGKDRVIGSDDSDSIAGLIGDDLLFGLGGSDVLDGGFGQNTLTGGKGSDRFVCAATDGDTITDFDATGGPGKQDFIDINGLTFEKARSDKDTLVTFEGGDILLLGIKPREIDTSDFVNM
jgi:Ca2+-binding RTX toxin-like protein